MSVTQMYPYGGPGRARPDFEPKIPAPPASDIIGRADRWLSDEERGRLSFALVGRVPPAAELK